MTMVICFTLSSVKDLPSSMAEINLHVPCSTSKSFLGAESSRFMTTFYKTGLPLAHELFHKIKGDATSHERLTREASADRQDSSPLTRGIARAACRWAASTSASYSSPWQATR